MPGITINFNAAEALSLRAIQAHGADLNRSLQRIATGKRINHASDDPAGAAAADNLKSEQQILLRRLARIDTDSHRYAAVDGALSVVSDQLIELQSAVVTAANTGGLSDNERKARQLDADSIIDTLAHLASTTVFNGEQILSGYLGAGSRMIVDGNTAVDTAATLNTLKSGGVNNLLTGNLEDAQKVVDNFVNAFAFTRASVGNMQKSLDSERNELLNRNENLSAAISQITDTDYATEISQMVRSQALSEAATFAVQAARDLQAQTVLALIRSNPLARTGRDQPPAPPLDAAPLAA